VQPDGAHTTILTQIEDKRLNAPNDICFDAKGGFYFSDPAWAARTPEGVARAEHSPPGDLLRRAGRSRLPGRRRPTVPQWLVCLAGRTIPDRGGDRNRLRPRLCHWEKRRIGQSEHPN
jgi:hypothetical protein